VLAGDNVAGVDEDVDRAGTLRREAQVLQTVLDA
jgi:hypothetical protein